VLLGDARLRIADTLTLRRTARTLGAGLASLVVLAGTITVFGVGLTVLDSAPAAAALTCNANWTGADSGNPTAWNDALNWSPASIPSGGSADACISGNASVVIPNASFSIGELTVSSGSTLTVGISGGGTTASLSVSAGLENDGTLTAGPSGSGFAGLTLNGSITNTGAFTGDGTVTIGSTVSSTVTNQGTWTLGTAGVVNMGGGSSFVQSGSGAQLTDTNVTGNTATVNNNSFNDPGNFVVDGGTICGTAPNLHGGSVGGADSLVFGSSTPAGPACGTGQAVDQIALSSGVNTLSGNVPAGYTLTTLSGATLEPNVTLTSNGAIVLNSGQLLDNTASTAFTNAGTFDVPANTSGSSLNVLSFTNSPSGAVSVEGTLAIGSTVNSTVTNQGTWTLGTAGVVNMGGASSFVQSGVLTDTNVTGNTATVNNNSFNDPGNFVVDGGTICGTAPNLHGGSVGGADSLVFGSGPIPGPNCTGGTAEDQIALSSGVNTLSGNVPAGYTLIALAGATIAPNVTLTNNGAIVLDSGQLLDNTTGAPFTNAGTMDVPTNTSGSSLNVLSFTNSPTGALDVEGTLTAGSTVNTVITNDGTIGVAPGAVINVGGSSSITNKSDGLLAFGIDGLPTSNNNYGRITNGTLSLGGTADPVFDNGFTPPAGTEYFVYTGSSGSYNGTFATVLHQATADYTHANEVGLTGGAPATPTTTGVTSSVPTSSVYGQSVQFTATVTGSGSNPTGSVSFYADGIYLGSAPVTTSAGVTTASLSVSNLRVGSESITATYNGDVVFDASTSPVLTQVVNQDPPTVTVTPSPTNPVPGQQVTYTVQVTATAPGAGTPTGGVSLTDNGTPIPGCQNLVMGPLGPSFVTCSVTYQSVSSHSIGASYAGDTDFSAATGSLSLSVQPATTATALVSSANPGPIGAPITYTATVSVVPPGTGTPTGTVSFTDQGSPVAGCQSLSLPSGAPLQVTCTETYGSNSAHSIVATYSGDANDASSHLGLVETLQQIGTQTTVGASSSTSTYGQSVTFTATVSPTQSTTGNPTGTVTFSDNGSTQIGTVGVSTTAGVTTAALTISSLTAGSHSVSVTYNGDSTFSTSSSTTSAALSVAQATTTVGLASTASPSVVGQTVTFTATISSSASGQTGTVQFADGGTPIGSGSVSGGQATLQTSSLGLGTHPITAVYEGDTNFVGSSTTATLSQVVNPAVTSTAIISDHNPGTVGQTITYTATVTVNSPGSGTPTGTVSFSDGGSPISTCQALSLPGTAPLQVTCQQVYATNASHSITAVYSSGGSNFGGSTGGPYTENLSQVSTTTSVMASPNTATYGQPVTLTATVAPTSGSANPSGSVTFTDNGTTSLGTSSLSTTAGVTTASILVTTLPVGTDLISASYGGGSGFGASATTTSASVTVSQSPTTLGLLSNVNPSTFGQSVTFTATVFPGTGSGETGIVTFFDQGNPVGTGSVSNGQATLTTSSLTVGTHPVTATYAGDTNFVGSSTTTTISQVVNKAPTSLSLGSSLNPSASGQSVTFTATVHPTTGSGETGTVTFFDNGTSIGTGGVSGGTATFTTSSLGVGSHPISATYGGDGSFAGSSTSSALSQVVNSSIVATATTLFSTINPSTVSQTPTLTAVISPAVGGGGPGGGPNNFTGTVTFYEGATVLGTSPVAARGEATISLPQLASTYAIGTHVYTATYSGDSNYLGSTSNPFSQVVAPPIFTSDGLGCDFSVVNSITDAVTNYPESTSTTCGTYAVNFLAVSPDGTHAYLMQPTGSSTTIKVINTATGGVIGTISLPAESMDLAMAPNGADLYVAERYVNQVAVISTATDAVVRNIPVNPGSGGFVWALAINPAGTELAVAMGVTGVQLVNLTTSTVAPLVPIFGGSQAVTFSPSGTTVYDASGARFITPGNGSVATISVASNSFTHAYVGLTEPFAAAATPDGTQLFTADQESNGQGGAVGVINLSSAATTFLVPNLQGGYSNITLSPDGTKVYAVNEGGSVTILNASSHAQVATITGFVANPDTVRPFGNTAPTPPPPPPPVRVTTTSLPVATRNVFYNTQLGATNGVGPYTWTLTGGSLPAGLSLSPNGAITGTPGAAAATSTFTVSVADSESPADTGTATLTLNVVAASTAPPSCAATAGVGSGLSGATACASGSNTTPGGTATATSTTTTGSVSVTAHGTGGITVGQYQSAPSGGVPFRAASNSFDVALSSLNTFTSVTVVDCALAGATSLQWWNPAASGGIGAWQLVSPATYNRFTRCLTITLSATSSPTLAQLTGTGFAGVLPAETVSISVGGTAPYSISGQVASGAITITQGSLVTQVSGTAFLSGSNGTPVPVTVSASCILGVCAGTFAVSDPASGVSITTPLTATIGTVNANQAGGQGLVFPGPGLKNSYPLSWNVSVSTS